MRYFLIFSILHFANLDLIYRAWEWSTTTGTDATNDEKQHGQQLHRGTYILSVLKIDVHILDPNHSYKDERQTSADKEDQNV